MQLMPSQRQLLLPEAIMKGNCRRLVQRGQVQQHVSSDKSMLLLATQSHLSAQTGTHACILGQARSAMHLLRQLP